METAIYTRGLDDAETVQFQHEFNAKAKDTTLGIVWALLLGGIGAHHFYMGRKGLGVLYILFCWTFVPLALAFLEAIFFMRGRVEAHNEQVAQDVLTKIKVMR